MSARATAKTTASPLERKAWWHDHREIAALIAWLDENARLPDDVAYLVEKPWKYDHEYGDMLAEQAQAGVIA